MKTKSIFEIFLISKIRDKTKNVSTFIKLLIFCEYFVLKILHIYAQLEMKDCIILQRIYGFHYIYPLSKLLKKLLINTISLILKW